MKLAIIGSRSIEELDLDKYIKKNLMLLLAAEQKVLIQ